MEPWREELVQWWYVGVYSISIQIIIVEWTDFVGGGYSEVALVGGTVDADNAVVLGLVGC